MDVQNKYDVVIIGGGLAGLSLAIQCGSVGLKTIIIEKGSYPRHKVCGEYISRESERFLRSLGLPLDDWDLPRIDSFTLTSHHGMSSSCALKPGGIGISRYKIDHFLYEQALKSGVDVIQNSKAVNVSGHNVVLQNGTNVHGNIVVGAYGRISGLQDNKIIQDEKYIGVKYHLDAGPEKNKIEIHNFSGGYCGISAIEDDKYCLCYLAKSSTFKANGNTIASFEDKVLKSNPFLAERLTANKIIEPVTTSQLFFGTNSDASMAQIGDAAGFIPPITGNGMSLAFRAAKVAFNNIKRYHEDHDKVLKEIQSYKKSYLSHRIGQGIFLQNLLLIEQKYFNKGLMFALNKIPGLLTIMSKQAVGKEI
jgi:menaquinone-9 beta-reductase